VAARWKHQTIFSTLPAFFIKLAMFPCARYLVGDAILIFVERGVSDVQVVCLNNSQRKQHITQVSVDPVYDGVFQNGAARMHIMKRPFSISPILGSTKAFEVPRHACKSISAFGFEQHGGC
jgi:hypothetical protein